MLFLTVSNIGVSIHAYDPESRGFESGLREYFLGMLCVTACTQNHHT